jgi:hypothetical protein
VSALRCAGVLLVGGHFGENDETALGQMKGYRVVAECNGGLDGNCGFREELPEWNDDPAWFITSEEMGALQQRHLAHSGRES